MDMAGYKKYPNVNVTQDIMKKELLIVENAKNLVKNVKD